MNGEQAKGCRICGRTTAKVYRHHVIPKVKGRKHRGTIECCKTCSRQIHMLFSESELAKMTFEELLNTEDMKRYITWIRERSGDFRARLSKRLRTKR